MWAHYLRLAGVGYKRRPVMTLLTVTAIATGIAACLVAMTLYHARAGNPISWKNDELFAITLDLNPEDPTELQSSRNPEYPPFQLTYRDAQAVFASDIPTRKAMMFKSQRMINPRRAGAKPMGVMARLTTADFFPMFETPFLYGSGWSAAADETMAPVVVISRRVNDLVFEGKDSVGQMIEVSGREFQVIGVLDTWMPQPKFYDLNNLGFELPEEIFLPFQWGINLRMRTAGAVRCLGGNVRISSYEALLGADCVWLQFWAELQSDEQRSRFQAFLDNYVRDQKQDGRFPRPLNNRIVKVSEWLEMNDVVGDQARIQLGLAVLFLVVCILNTLGLTLARVLSDAPASGLRRALGATRGDIVRQHMVEVVLLGLFSGAVGVLLAMGGLWMIRHLLYLPMALSGGNPDAAQIAQSLSHFDGTMAIAAVGLSLLTGILAGLYPAWRVGRVSPASFLKAL